MADKKSFLMYKSWAPLIMAMQDDQAGMLFKAVYEYQLTGEEPPKGCSFYPMFSLFKATFDENKAAYEKTCETNRRITEERERKKTERNEPLRSVTECHHSIPDNDKDKDNDKDNDKEKDSEKIENPKRTQAALVGESNLSDPVKEKLMEWLAYKKERREGYKETGLKSLITEVGRHEQESGSTAVINLINQCMANGWRGIIWEKIQAAPTARSGTTNVFDAWDRA